jgi:hypothetical protein
MEMDIKLGAKGDLLAFKQELVSSLKRGQANTAKEVEELVNSLSKKYEVNAGSAKKPLVAMDTVEEALLRPNASIQNLANPKTISNLFTQYGYETKVKPKNISDVFKTHEQIAHLASLPKRTEWQQAQLD